jgi:hypothetical protein
MVCLRVRFYRGRSFRVRGSLFFVTTVFMSFVLVRAFVHSAGKPLLDYLSNILIQRTGVCLLLLNAEFRQKIEDHRRFHLQLSGQLIDANFTHMVTPRFHGKRG